MYTISNVHVYLFPRFELFRVETVEQQRQEKIQYHEISHHQSGKKYEKARLGNPLKIQINHMTSLIYHSKIKRR